MKAAACLLLWHKRVTVSEAVGRNQYFAQKLGRTEGDIFGLSWKKQGNQDPRKEKKKEVGGTKLSILLLFRILALETNTLSISEALEKLTTFFI